ncbi:phage/plasmid primase, P4 family [Jeotgalibacillus sp. JSM ZJ347]|uniref:phage/plasmid primase, P4 family n=1 Tax=Jeotgalibacillus sp. JSM ZJ347 TaxID=3342117 RepID=UPI0035A95C72
MNYRNMPRNNGKLSKVPFDPITGNNVSVKDPQALLSFEEALHALNINNPKVDGLGIVLTGEHDLIGIDIDDCIDNNGEFNEVASHIVNLLREVAYIEKSPSGKGLHLIFKGHRGNSKNRNSDYNVEIYTDQRFLTCTGDVISSPSEIGYAHNLYEIEKAYFLDSPKHQQPASLFPNSEDILQVMIRSERGTEIQQLLNGDTSAYYGDHSSADLALCNHLAFYTQKDTHMMDQIFRSSGLYRAKWDSKRSSDGRTYGQMTIEKAVQGVSSVYGGNLLPRIGSIGQKPKIAELTDKKLPDWYEEGHKGSIKFIPDILADEMTKDGTLLYSQPYFYEKKGGVYRKINDEKQVELRIKNHLLKGHIRPRYIKDTLELLKLNVLYLGDLFDVKSLNGNINFINGMYHVLEGEFRPHPSELKTALQLNVSYDADAECPQFEAFLRSVLNEKDIPIIQEMIGYLLTASNKAEKAFILYGPGRNGKSTIIKIIEQILGSEYVSNVSMQDLSKRFSIANLHGKLLNTFADLPAKPFEDTSLFKILVSGDGVQAENKFQQPFKFNNTARLLFSCNELPLNYVDRSEGFFRRLQLIPLTKKIPENQIDPHLFEKLLTEKAGIVIWALRGLKRLVENNYQFSRSDSTDNLLKDYKKNTNNVIWFVEDYCKMSYEAKITGQQLFKAYESKCIAEGKQAISKKKFNQSLLMEYPAIHKFENANRVIAFKGITLK